MQVRNKGQYVLALIAERAATSDLCFVPFQAHCWRSILSCMLTVAFCCAQPLTTQSTPRAGPRRRGCLRL